MSDEETITGGIGSGAPPPCHGLTDLFFAHSRLMQAKAKAICRTCDRMSSCLDYALTRRHVGQGTGVWGGATDKERRKMLREARSRRPAA